MKKIKTLVLYFILLPYFSFAQEATETINYSSRQGVDASCGFSSCNYFQTFGDLISFQSGTTSSSTKNARYLFNHPNFKNSDIKKIVLQIQINKVLYSTTLAANMYIRMPFNSCNNVISWSGFPDYSSLYSCIENGNKIFQDGLGTSNTAPTTFNLLIYDKLLTGFQGQTLSLADPNSSSFTIAFSPVNGAIEISSVKTIITYGCTIPAIPSLNASSNSTSSINLNWPNVVGATSYEIYNCNTNKIVSTITSTSYTINGLNQGTSYNYKIRSKNNCGSSNFSNCVSASTLGCSAAPLTASLASSSVTVSSINLSWQNVSGATSYEIYDCNTNQIITTTTNTSFTVNGLNQGTSYNYKIRSKNNCGSSNFSNCVSASTLGCSAAPLTASLTPSSATVSSVDLSWQNVSGATSYEIYDCDTNQIITTTTNTSFTVNGLNPGSSYNYKIRAKNSCGNSAFSNCVAILTLGCRSNYTINNINDLFGLWTASDYVNISNSAVISGKSLLVKAQNSINLLPGTSLEYGSNVLLKIENCINPVERLGYSKSVSSEENIYNYEIPHNQEKLIFEIEDIVNDKNILLNYTFDLPQDKHQMKVYPIPTTGILNINLNIKDIDGLLSLYSSANELILEKQVKSNIESIDLTSFPSGLYILKYTKNDIIIFSKVVKL